MTKLFPNHAFAPFQRLSIRWWLLLGAFLLLWRLDYAGFWDPDEARYAAASYEMAHPFDGASDWVVPHLNSIPRLNKPPLVYWLGAISINIFGVNEWAGRMVPALAAIGIMLLLWQLGRKMFDEITGICAALIWATCGFSFAMARIFGTDMLLAAAMTLAGTGIWFALEDEDGDRSRARKLVAYIVAGIGMGLGLLAKGPVGPAIPLVVVFMYLCLARRWSRVYWPGVFLTLFIALAMAAPWFAAMESQRPGFVKNFIFAENLARYSGKGDFHNATPFHFYYAILIPRLLPWAGFLALVFRSGRAKEEMQGAWRGRLFLLLWAGFIITFFSLSRTKLVSYDLPAFPALALLLGEGIGFLVRNPQRVTLPRRLALIFTISGNVLLFVVLSLSMLNNKIIDESGALPLVAGLGAATLLGCAVSLVFWKRDVWKWFCGYAISSTALLLAVIAIAGRVSLYQEASPIFKAAQPILKQGDVFMEYRTFQASAIFYLHEPMYIAQFENNSGFDESHPNYQKLFPGEKEMAQIIKNAPRWFILAKRSHPEAATKFGKTYTIARNNKYVLLSNQPAPPGFQYDFVAPGKQIVKPAPPEPRG